MDWGFLIEENFLLLLLLFLAVFIYGSFALAPLTWKQCFVFQDSFKSYLALNPLQNFFATLKLRKPEFNEKKAREAFPVMAEWMQLPDKNDFSYRREIVHPEAKHWKAVPILYW